VGEELKAGLSGFKKKTLRVVGFKSHKFILLLHTLKPKHPQKNRI
jgi:hypothetical protein